MQGHVAMWPCSSSRGPRPAANQTAQQAQHEEKSTDSDFVPGGGERSPSQQRLRERGGGPVKEPEAAWQAD